MTWCLQTLARRPTTSPIIFFSFPFYISGLYVFGLMIDKLVLESGNVSVCVYLYTHRTEVCVVSDMPGDSRIRGWQRHDEQQSIPGLLTDWTLPECGRERWKRNVHIHGCYHICWDCSLTVWKCHKCLFCFPVSVCMHLFGSLTYGSVWICTTNVYDYLLLGPFKCLFVRVFLFLVLFWDFGCVFPCPNTCVLLNCLPSCVWMLILPNVVHLCLTV